MLLAGSTRPPMIMNPPGICEQKPTLDVVLATVPPPYDSSVRKAWKLAKLLVTSHDLIAMRRQVQTAGVETLGNAGVTLYSNRFFRTFGAAVTLHSNPGMTDVCFQQISGL